MKRKFIFSGVVAAMLLASCVPTTSSSNSPSVTEPTVPSISDITDPTIGSSTSEPSISDPSVSDPSTPAEGFTKEEYGSVYGTFFGADGAILIEHDITKVITDEDEVTILTPNEIKEETFAYELDDVEDDTSAPSNVKGVSVYLSDDMGVEYRLRLTPTKKMLLLLEKKVGETFQEVTTYMPDISSITGFYDFIGDNDPYNIGFSIDGTFSIEKDVFLIAKAGYDWESINIEYALSFLYANEEGDIVVGFDYYDYVDDYLYFSVFPVIENNTLTLNDIYDPETVTFYTSLEFLRADLFDGSNTYISEPDYDNMTIKMSTNDEVTTYTNLTSVVDDKGFYVTAQHSGVEYVLTPSVYGIIQSYNLADTDTVILFVWDDTSDLEGKYSYRGNVFEYTLSVDDVYELTYNSIELSDFSYSISHNYKSVQFITSEKTHVFYPEVGDIAINGIVDGEHAYYVNEEHYIDQFGSSLTSFSDEHDYTLRISSIGDGINIDMTVNSSFMYLSAFFVYSPNEEFPTLVFGDVDGVSDEPSYTLSIIQDDLFMYSLTSDEGLDIYVISDIITEHLYSMFTSNNQDTILIDGYSGIDYKSKSATSFELLPHYDADSFTHQISINADFADGTSVMLIFLNNTIYVYETINGQTVVSSFIEINNFGQLFGRYVLDGKYGVEAIELSPNGTFTADTANATNDGLIYDVEYDYIVAMVSYNGDLVPTIGFIVGEGDQTVVIYGYKVGVSLIVAQNNYVIDSLFSYQGFYADTSNENYIWFKDGSVSFNGSELQIKSIAKIDGLSMRIFFDDDVISMIDFRTTNDNYTNPEATLRFNDISLGAIILNKVDVDLRDYLGSYTDGTNTVEVKIGQTFGGLDKVVFVIDGFTFDALIKTEDGKVVVYVETISAEYQLYDDGTTITLTVISGLLPPPPPPPPPL